MAALKKYENRSYFFPLGIFPGTLLHLPGDRELLLKKATAAWAEHEEDKPNYKEVVAKGKSCKRGKRGKKPGAICK